jgi:glutamyl-tRNA synthetase
MSVVTRFSPSPTGYLHVGNIRVALINYLYSCKNAGKFYLRFDDTDIERSKSEYADQISKDLQWLGLVNDLEVKQSDRLDVYEKVKQKLIKSGRLYPCFETAEELAVKRKILVSRSLPPIYDRAALKLSKDEIDKLIADGKKPHYRFLLNDKETKWQDGIRGDISFKSRAFSDPVLVRENEAPTYTFCSVVDDIEYNITDIIRGEDHITNTAIQIQIFEALGGKLPRFAHLSLIKTKTGGMSKRIGGFEIMSLRERGVDAMAINSLLAKLGSSENVQPIAKMQQLVDSFALEHFSHGAINYNEADLFEINHKLLIECEFVDVKAKLADLGLSNVSKQVWDICKLNINNYLDLKEWVKIIELDFQMPDFTDEEKSLLRDAAKLLPEKFEVIDDFKNWINSISNKTHKKGKMLYQPLRLAVTGRSNGPELSKLLTLIDIKKLGDRLSGL